MKAAITLLRYERRWLYAAYEQAAAEMLADYANARLVRAQMARLVSEIEDVTDALLVLGDVADGKRARPRTVAA